MPNRILKESICTSETINSLTFEEEVFFYRLLVNCDDYGRLDARPSILRAKCFPLRVDSISDARIEQWLAKLVAVGLIRLYGVDGKRYLQVVTWDKHQQVRAKRSKYPAPESGSELVISNDSMCQQTKSSDGICPRESESESRSESEKESRSEKAMCSETEHDGPPPACNSSNLNEQAKRVMDEYNRIFQACWKRPLQLTPDRLAKIKARLKRFSVEELITAMESIRASPFHCGDNDRGQVYATPEFIFRNDAQVDKWLKVKNARSPTRINRNVARALELAEKYRLEEEGLADEKARDRPLVGAGVGGVAEVRDKR